MADQAIHDPNDTAGLLRVMHQAADAAGRAILPFFRTGIDIEEKASDRRFDPVTEGDRAGEQAVRDVLAARVPNHAVVGEELGAVSADGDCPYRWVIDPIDGTRGFILGLPTWGTLIGLEKDGVPLMGMMDQPYVGDRFFSDGTSSYLRDRAGRTHRLRTRSTATIATAHMASTHPDIFAEGMERHVFDHMRAQARDTRFGTDCYAYCLLAAGLVDMVIEAGLQPYDVSALVPIIENAGGRITTWDGGPAAGGGRILATGSETLHREALQLIASTATRA
jgi:myo-inositol-1(or 4)-monophosphatase